MTMDASRYPLDRNDPMAVVERVRAAERRGDTDAVETLVDWLREGVVDELPDARTAWQAWSRLLDLRGDPRGELVSLAEQAATATGRAAERLVDQMAMIVAGNRPGWMGDALRAIDTRDRDSLELRWRHGFIVAAAMDGGLWRMEHGRTVSLEPAVERLEALFAAPAAELLTRLQVRSYAPWYGFEPRAIVRHLVERAPAALRTLRLGRHHDLTHLDARVVVDVGELLTACPRLRHLELGARGIVPEPFRGERLESLHLSLLDLAGDVLRALGRSALPRLQTLTLGSERAGVQDIDQANRTAEVAHLDPLLAGETAPALRELSLCGVAFADGLVRRLTDSPLLAQLDTLELRGGTITEATAQHIVEHAAAFEGTRLKFSALHAGAALKGALPDCQLV